MITMKKHIDEAKTRVEECKKLEKYNEIEQIDCENVKLAKNIQMGKNTWEDKDNAEIYKKLH